MRFTLATFSSMSMVGDYRSTTTVDSFSNYCEECFSTDGRRWSFDSGDRFGTDPIALLSTWEHRTLERMLKEL